MGLIGLETSAIMPLLEVTPRTLPLQKRIQEVQQSISKVEFVTDSYSVEEARQQIEVSYTSALRSLDKTFLIAQRDKLSHPHLLSVTFVKCLAENWYGREETLRWSDCLLPVLTSSLTYDTFFDQVKDALASKRDAYLSVLRLDAEWLEIDCKHILPYWVTPTFLTDLRIRVRVIPNSLSLSEFFNTLQNLLGEPMWKKLRVNDVTDLFHLYSLYHDAKAREIWSCNQEFVRRHKRYIANLSGFSELFDPNYVRIVRIVR